MFKKVSTTISISILIVASLALILMVARGHVSSPIANQNREVNERRIGGPFETSGSTSRYVLTEAIVEDGTFFLSEERARSAAPDVSGHKGRYFSIFTPGVSIIGIPFYMIGKQLNQPQLATYLSTTLLSLLNVVLIYKIAQKLGGSKLTSLIGGFMFVFGTFALAYSSTFTQHHASTLIILVATLSALANRTLLNNIWFGFLFGAGLFMDMPNGLIMLPLVVYVLFKQLEIKKQKNDYNLSFKLNFVGLLLGLLPMLFILGLYNYQLTGSYTSLPQFVGRIGDFDNQRILKLESDQDVGIRLPFNTRNQLNGLITFFLSDERSIPVYAPVLLIGAIGFYTAYKLKTKREQTIVVSGVVLMNLLTYMLFVDPTGSWAFGPRYLIPGAAVLSIGIGIAIEKYKKNLLFIAVFLVLSAYSIGVSVMGAMTTTQVPPKVEAVNLPSPVPYTYEYNWQLMKEEGLNSSLFYNLYLSDKYSSYDFALMYAAMAFGIVTVLYMISLQESRKAI